MTPELLHHLRSLSRFIYFVTDEEDRFLLKLKDVLKKFLNRTYVYNYAFGLVSIENITRDWGTRAHAVSNELQGIHDALIHIYKEDPKDEQNFFIFTDPERALSDPHVVRRFLNIAHQVHSDIRNIKICIFVGHRRFIPEQLARYVEVVEDRGLNENEITEVVQNACTQLDLEVPADAPELFKGLTSFEIDAAIAQSVVKTRKEGNRRVEPKYITTYRRRQVKKTNLVQYVPSDVSFDQIGGADRFKTWAKETSASWTKEGREFGLEVPKGVLLTGVWGTGKSMSAKALGHEWGVPVIQLEMGKLRSSGVGDSEGNIYRALRIIESAQPCIVWIDEAEKSLSGGQSSAASDSGTTSRVIGIFSTWTQETTAKVCLVLTANTLKTLPVEFVNRAEDRFFFDLPNEKERIDVLKIHLLKRKQDPARFNLAKLAEASKQMVGREIEQVVKGALRRSFVRHGAEGGLREDILLDDLVRKPRIIKTMMDEVKEIVDWVGYDPETDDGIKAMYASAPSKERIGGGLTVVK